MTDKRATWLTVETAETCAAMKPIAGWGSGWLDLHENARLRRMGDEAERTRRVHRLYEEQHWPVGAVEAGRRAAALRTQHYADFTLSARRAGKHVHETYARLSTGLRVNKVPDNLRGSPGLIAKHSARDGLMCFRIKLSGEVAATFTRPVIPGQPQAGAHLALMLVQLDKLTGNASVKWLNQFMAIIGVRGYLWRTGGVMCAICYKSQDTSLLTDSQAKLVHQPIVAAYMPGDVAIFDMGTPGPLTWLGPLNPEGSS